MMVFATTYTTTYTTTMEITYNYLTLISGTTVFAGYITSTTTTVVATVTSISGSSSTGVSSTVRSTSNIATSNLVSSATLTQTPKDQNVPPINGFTIESIILGLLLGILLLFLARRKKQE